MSISINTTNRVFKDLDLTFKANPITGDIVKKYDENAIKASIKNLVLMKPYEVPFHPEISCQANNMLFELGGPATAELVKTSIIQVITKFEPRISAFDVTVNDDIDNNAYNIVVDFVMKGSNKTVTVETMLYRTR